MGSVTSFRSRLAICEDECGVTLIEVLIAAVIVGIAAVGVALMFSTGQAYIDAEGDNRTTLFLAQQGVEQYRARGYQGLRALGAPIMLTAENPITNYPGYRRQVILRCLASPDDYSLDPIESCTDLSGNPLPVRIDVEVRTTPTNAKARTITLVSVLAPR